MKFHSNFSSSLVTGAFLVAGTFMLTQTASGAGTQHNSGHTQSSVQQTQSGAGGSSHATQEKMSGENPLYESKDKANPKPNTGASNVQPYKDGEDMTTRYRPGNNKTTASPIAVDHPGGNGVRRMDGGQNGGTSGSSGPSTETQARKHIAGVKYQDRVSGGSNHGQTSGSAGQASTH